MKKFIAPFILASIAVLPSFADEYTDLEKFNTGNSMAWFYSLRTQTQNLDKASEIEAKLCEKITSGKLSAEAFRYACNLIRPIASNAVVDVLKPYLLDDVRCPYVCDVFVVLDSSDVDDALADALEQALAKISADANKNSLPKVIENLVSAISVRGNDKASVIAVANGKDKQLALFAVRALARFKDSAGLMALFDTSVVDVLNDIVAKNDYRKADAVNSLEFIAITAMADGKKSIARKALKNVPENRPNTVAVRAKLMRENERVKYLDALIAEGGELSNAAGKAMNEGRTFENSAWLISKFPTLNRKAKLAAMGSFMITGDTRFYPVIAKELDNPDSDIRGLAIYSARFLCTDDANMARIFNIFKTEQSPMRNYAESVLLENSSFAVQRVLKEKAEAGDMDAIELLIRRGDKSYKDKIWQAFLNEKTRTVAVVKVFERTVTAGDISVLAKEYKKNDKALSLEITKIIIKKMAQYRISRQYIAKALKEALQGNLDKSDANYKLIVEKLKVKDLM